MKWFVKVLQVIYSLYAILLFVAILIVLTPIIVIASFFGKISGGNFIYLLCSGYAHTWLPLIGIIPKRIYQSPHEKSHPVIFVANHNSYLDAPMIVAAVQQPVRALGKVELSKIPLFGFLYRNTVVMVDRSSPENRAKSVKTLKRVLEKGISIFIFPEGTFNESDQPLKDFYDGAFRIAIETQTPIKPLIFPDAVNRMHYRSAFAFSPGKCRSVFLEEVSVEGLTSKDMEALKQRVYAIMEKALIEYKAK